jgi:predicted HD superfamily hydrolase involved in NAD metabolism
MSEPGIPSELTLERVRQWVKPRVSEKRFRHIEGVVDVSRQLASKAGCNQYLAELTGWLHDACKEVKDKELVEMAKAFKLPLDPILEQYGHLLHGPVAAAVASHELGITNELVLNAVAEHTLGAVPMTPLSQVAFLADCLEPGRPADYTQPIWKALDIDGAANFEAAIVVATDLGIGYLLEEHKAIHPRTVEVRNYYLPALVKASRPV